MFDGYESPSTKDEEHIRRAAKLSSADVMVDVQTQASISQTDFLSNNSNKTRFISLLTNYLVAGGCCVHQAAADADTLIVSTAAMVADAGQKSVLVGEDTDLLILPIALAMNNVDIQMLIHRNQDTTRQGV